jgi:hypothetical protein
MISFSDAASILAAPTYVPNDSVLQQLLADRIHDWAASDLLGLTSLLIVEAGDSEQDIVDEVGFSPLVSIDGIRFPAPGYLPPFDFAEQHAGWTELIQVVPNDPFAFVLFIEHADGADPDLLQLCRAHAEGVPA